MDQSNFKKLALAGMATGFLFGAQSPAMADSSTDTVLAHGCGSSCGGGTKRQYNGGSCGAPTRASCAGAPNRGGSCGAPNRGGSCGGSSPYNNNYTADAYDTQTQGQFQQQRPLTSNELENQLTDENRALFRSLDPEAKALAIRLAIQNRDKNDAVKQAARRMQERQGMMNSSNRMINQ